MIIFCRRIHRVALAVAIAAPASLPLKMNAWNRNSRAPIRSHPAPAVQFYYYNVLIKLLEFIYEQVYAVIYTNEKDKQLSHMATNERSNCIAFMYI